MMREGDAIQKVQITRRRNPTSSLPSFPHSENPTQSSSSSSRSSPRAVILSAVIRRLVLVIYSDELVEVLSGNKDDEEPIVPRQISLDAARVDNEEGEERDTHLSSGESFTRIISE